MAEPFSVSASIAGLVTITDSVFRRTFQSVKAVKGAPDEVSSLTSALGTLSGILHNLQLVAAEFEGESFDTTIQINHVHSCMQTVEKIEKILDKYHTSPAVPQKIEEIKRLKWPFSVSEARALCVEIEQHKATFSLALNVDGMTAFLQTLSRQKDLQNGIDDIKSEFQRKREVETRITISTERRKVLDWIQPYDPHQNHTMNLKIRHPGTGFWLIESDEFKSWLSSPRARLWYYGIPGAGKTVLASSAIQEALERTSPYIAVAFFYCDYKNVATQNPRNILGSLACQLALQDEQSFGDLQAFYAKYEPPDRPSIGFDHDKLCDLLVEMAASFDDVMIIVDALDECDAQTKLVTRLLSSLSDGNESSNIKTIFFSRDEQEIREILEGFDQVPISAKSSDLKLFVEWEIGFRIRKKRLRINDISLKDDIMKRLVEDADGMFRWVACQMDHLCELPNDAARRKALKTPPFTLHATYERILHRVIQRSKESQQLVQRSLCWLSCFKEQLTSLALCEAVSIEFGDKTLNRSAVPDEQEILHLCSGLVRRSASGNSLELAHFTVKQLLTIGIDNFDKNYSFYHLNPDSVDVELARTCLTYLSFDTFGCWNSQRFEPFAFHKYAVRYCTRYLTQVQRVYNSSPDVQQLVQRSHGKVVQTLLDEGADVSAQGGLYGNALQAASSRCHDEVVQMLLDKGADVSAIRRNDPATPLIFEDCEDADSDSDRSASIASSTWSELSKSSASSQASNHDTLVAALDEVILVFVNDKDFQVLFADAISKYDGEKVVRNCVRLFKPLGRRLVMAAKTPIEKEAAKILLSRRNGRSIVGKIAQVLTPVSSKEDRQEQLKKFQDQKATKHEILENYLRNKTETPPVVLPSEARSLSLNKTSYDEGDSDDSNESEDREEEKQRPLSWKVEALREFLRTSDAFARLKEEFEDFISPFSSQAMWTKTLWDNGDLVRFESPSMIPPLTKFDKFKLAIEQKIGMPIIWWPLKQPRKYLPSQKVRIIWVCGCGHEIYADVSCTQARKYRQLCDTNASAVEVAPGNPSTLPTSNESLLGSSNGWGLRTVASARTGNLSSSLPVRQPQGPQPSQRPNQNMTNTPIRYPMSKYIHWCVDTAERRTFLHHICIERNQGKDFIKELCKSYRKLRGWKWYLSMTTCTEIRLVRLARVHEEEEVVICTWQGKVLPDLNSQKEYTYSINPPNLAEEIHVLRAERALIDFYHGHTKCSTTAQISKHILGVPHRINGTQLNTTGYGIYARQGWTLYRLAIFALVTQGWAILFVAFWLWYHPGDLQNAFSPAYYSLGLVTIFIALPDVFSDQNHAGNRFEKTE